MRNGFWILPLCAAIAPCVSAQDLIVEDFEGYANEAEMDAEWVYNRAGGPEGLFIWLNGDFETPQGNQCLELEIDMPEKWWYNHYKRSIPGAPLDLNEYVAVTFWMHGDPELDGAAMDAVVFLYDGTGRILRFQIPDDQITTGEWQKLILAVDSFSEETWDTGYGTDTPDANWEDIVEVGFMVVGDRDGVSSRLFFDDIRFATELPVSSVQGTVLVDEAPMAGVTVHALGEGSRTEAVTGADGTYAFPELSQGKHFRLVPVLDGYDFDPGAAGVTLLQDAYTIDFAGFPSEHERLDTTEIADPFDEAGLNPAIAYRGVAQWNNPGNERPVIDVRNEMTYETGFPDAEQVVATLPPIGPNPLDGATSPAFAVKIGQSYAWDMLAIGQNTSRDYYVEVDAYCELRPEIASGYDRVSLGARCNAMNPGQPTLDGDGDAVYWSTGGYALSFETDTGEIAARRYAPSNHTARTQQRLEGFAEEYASVVLDESGWHRLRIECVGDSIAFIVDGGILAEVEDSMYEWGPAGLHYRMAFPDLPAELQLAHHARFDNLKAGPMRETPVENWMLTR